MASVKCDRRPAQQQTACARPIGDIAARVAQLSIRVLEVAWSPEWDTVDL